MGKEEDTPLGGISTLAPVMNIIADCAADSIMKSLGLGFGAVELPALRDVAESSTSSFPIAPEVKNFLDDTLSRLNDRMSKRLRTSRAKPHRLHRHSRKGRCEIRKTLQLPLRTRLKARF